jgi:hypothetical protein
MYVCVCVCVGGVHMYSRYRYVGTSCSFVEYLCHVPLCSQKNGIKNRMNAHGVFYSAASSRTTRETHHSHQWLIHP